MHNQYETTAHAALQVATDLEGVMTVVISNAGARHTAAAMECTSGRVTPIDLASKLNREDRDLIKLACQRAQELKEI